MKSIILCISVLSFSLFGGCSKNELKGTVVEGSAKKPIKGVMITVEGTNLITLSDSIGQYYFTDFPEGTQTLKFSKEGHETQVLIISTSDTKEGIRQIELNYDRPANEMIKDFINRKYPASINVFGLGTVTHKNVSVKIKNQWLDENENGVFYIEVEIETHAFYGPRHFDDGMRGKQFGAVKFIDTYVFIKKGDKWEPKKDRIGSERIWKQGNML